jgi:hypothetical protein
MPLTWSRPIAQPALDHPADHLRALLSTLPAFTAYRLDDPAWLALARRVMATMTTR